jgi:hypothetical protein
MLAAQVASNGEAGKSCPQKYSTRILHENLAEELDNRSQWQERAEDIRRN